MKTFTDAVELWKSCMNTTAIVYNEKHITYADVLAKVNNYRSKICFDIKHATKVGLLLNNSESFLCLFLGLVLQNYVPVLFDPSWNKQLMAEMVKHLGIKQIVTEENFVKDYSFDSFLKLDDFMDDRLNLIVPNYDNENNLPDNSLYVGFTSGTTAFPKAFIQTQDAWINSFNASTEEFEINRGDSILITGLLNYGFSLYPAIEGLCMGATLYILEKYNVSMINKIIMKKNKLTVYSVPTVLFDIVQEIEKTNTVCNNVDKIITAGAKLENSLSGKINKYMPSAKVYEYYGASELGFVSVRKLFQTRNAEGSVGIPFNGVEIKIYKKNDIEARIGEIWVKSRYISHGYLFNSGKPAFRKDGEWATVGDLGYMEGSELFIIGRQEDMIISGGNNIYFSEIEDVFKSMDGILDAVATGKNDERLGQILCVTLISSSKKTYSDICTCCAKYLPHYKIPKKIYQCKSFPRNNSGKISRKIISDSIERGEYCEL